MQSFKRGTALFFPLLLGLLFLTACKKETAAGDLPGVAGIAPGKAVVYFKIEASDGTAFTRADSDDLAPDGDDTHVSGDLVNGSEAEHQLGPGGHYVLYFDAAGKFQSVEALVQTTHGAVDDPDDEGQHVRETVYVSRISVEEDYVLPKCCLVVLNGAQLYPRLTDKLGSPLGEILDLLLEDSADPTRIGRDGAYFTMTNAVWVEGGAVKTAVDFPSDAIQDEDSPFDETKVIIVHVERMLSKFTLALKNYAAEENGKIIYRAANTTDEPDRDQIFLCTGWSKKTDDGTGETDDWAPVVEPQTPWQARVESWGMNALEKESRVFKGLDAAGYDDFFIGWNDARNYRSYWAEDRHYGTDAYPWQWRKAVNCRHEWFRWYGEKGDGNILMNYPYNAPQLGYPLSGAVIYTPENTYNASALADKLDGRTELLAGTHLIVRATMMIQQNGTYVVPEHLYRDRAGVYYTTAKDCLWGLVRYFNYALASQTRMEYRYYDWKGDEETKTLYAVPSLTYLEGIEEPFRLYYGRLPMTYEYIMGMEETDCQKLLAEAYIKDGDGKRLLNTEGFSVRKSDGTILPIYSRFDIGVDENWEEYDNSKYLLKDRTAEQIANDMQSLFFEWAGAVDYWKDGQMYYAAPPQIVEEKVYGAVRNAWYQFTVTGINNVGIPVHDAGMPIVPNWEDPFDQMNVKVNILPWHRVEYGIPWTPFS